ncbi:class I SAM-dependent methyltransferase [Maridesulfovibrio ferrireducens]|uniref:class I SAM-dependent methyltransferase n=1 Tax=Maridesulfovibrio ferrireducens TaxID=246191 RepID=UPI001A34AD9B|nr:class I SAM-dependent methyltransferase [Maridesulfovibrio ferrireducens]MBI9110702.1 class I SAM-dependent methyltransferase [Maridesulfovibrio ferrireducens]
MHVCPWWLTYTFDNFLRRMLDPVDDALSKWVKPGMTVLDFGCGFGHYSIGAAQLVGKGGKVIAVDLQDKMLEIAMERAARAGVDDIISPHKCGPLKIGYTGKVDFVVSGHVLHETPDLEGAFREVFSVLKPGGGFYFTEPRMHVKDEFYRAELATAAKVGFKVTELPSVLLAYRAYLSK